MPGRLFDEDFLQRLQRLAVLAKRIAAARAASGQRRARRLGDGLEFADRRQYAPGDDVRFIDWPYYARMERLLIRLFHEHSEGSVRVLVDCSASMRVGQAKFDHARRVSAALAYVAMGSLDRVDVLPLADGLGEGVVTGRSRGRILQVLDFLERLTPAGPTRLAAAVEQFIRRHAQPATLFLVSDGIDIEGDLPRALALLRQHRDETALVHVIDPADADPPMLGPSRLRAVESEGRLAVNVTPALAESYRARWGEFCRATEKACLAGSASYVQAPTELPFERLVLQVLARMGLSP